MLREKPFDAVQIGSPHFRPLVRQSSYEINTDVAEFALPQSVDITEDIGTAVKVACVLEVFIVKRLYAKADPIYSGIEVPVQRLVSQRTRIDFNADLGSTLRQCRDDLLNKPSVYDRRRAASEKDRIRMP